MTKYGRSPWIDQFPKSRVPALPRQHGPLQSDVVIIGGGLTGCATAYAFAVAGVKVVLVEAAQIGRGNSGSSAGWISEDPGIAFTDLEKALGTRSARRAWQGWRRAALDFAALLIQDNSRVANSCTPAFLKQSAGHGRWLPLSLDVSENMRVRPTWRERTIDEKSVSHRLRRHLTRAK